MIRIKVLFYCALTLLLFQCHAGKQPECPVAHLEQVGESSLRVKLSEIADSIRYIPLETSDSCLLPGKSSIAGLTDGYIYVMGEKLYQFTAGGRFVRQIGELGRGPEEYINLSSASIHKDKIYITTWGGEVIVYDLNGKFIRRARTIPGASSSTVVMNDSVYIREEKEYLGEKGYKQYLSVYLNDSLSKKILIYEDDLNADNNLVMPGEFTSRNGEIYYKSCFDNTIYRIDRNLNPVKYRFLAFPEPWPNRPMLEDLKEFKNTFQAGILFCLSNRETNRYDFIWAGRRGKSIFSVYDKNKESLIYDEVIEEGHSFLQNKGIEDDITRIGTKFWPVYTSEDGKRAIALTNPSAYDERVLANLREKGINLDENSNPLLAVCYLKDR